MNREALLKLAQEIWGKSDWNDAQARRLERFAALVAAAEREACAKVCEETTAAWTQHLYNSGCMDCAAAIRARGEK